MKKILTFIILCLGINHAFAMEQASDLIPVMETWQKNNPIISLLDVKSFSSLTQVCIRLQALCNNIGTKYLAINFSDAAEYGNKNLIGRFIKHYEQQAQEAEKYNSTMCLLTMLPLEKLFDIVIHCHTQDSDLIKWSEKSTKEHYLDTDSVKMFEKSIKTFMNLSSVCKCFNELLSDKVIAELCKGYAQKDKDIALKKLLDLRLIDRVNYKANRLYAFMLIYAGVDVNTATAGYGPLLVSMAYHDDLELVDELFNHDANVNTRNHFFEPAFFHAKTTQMVEKFVSAKNFDIHATSTAGNVLWYLTRHSDLLELMRFYLEHGVKADDIDCNTNDCILHLLAWKYNINNTGCFQKAKLLLPKASHLINTLNYTGQTVLDVAQKSWQHYKKLPGWEEKTLELEQLIKLYKDYGGVTAQQLGEIAVEENIKRFFSANHTKNQ